MKGNEMEKEDCVRQESEIKTSNGYGIAHAVTATRYRGNEREEGVN